MEKQNDYSHLTENESLHNQFTAYTVIAIQRMKSRYLMKKSKNDRMCLSLDEMLEDNVHGSALTLSFDDMEDSFDSGISLENIICNDMLLAGICMLSDRERKILNYRFTLDMKHAEIADSLGTNKNAVEKAYERLIKKLRTHMRSSINETV